jgi:hypothetical protein
MKSHTKEYEMCALILLQDCMLEPQTFHIIDCFSASSAVQYTAQPVFLEKCSTAQPSYEVKTAAEWGQIVF